MQKKKNLLLIVISLCTVIVVGAVCSFLIWPATSYASSVEFSGEYAFSDKFYREATALTQKGWSDDYFGSIMMRVGEDKFWVDGVSYESESAEVIHDELHLPIVDIAGALKYNVMINESTGDTSVNYDGRQTTHRGRDRRAKKQDIEQALNFDISQRDGIVTIRNDFQTKQLILRSRELKLKNTFGASEFVTDGRGFYILQYNTERQARQAHKNFMANKNTKYVEPNSVVVVPWTMDEETGSKTVEELPAGNPGDKPAGASPFPNRWGSIRIGADDMIDYLVNNNKTNSEVLVAVVDTGVNHAHPYFNTPMQPSARIRTDLGWDFVSTKQSSDVSDGNGHGTHVAGTIVDCTPSNVKILPVKVLSASGSGPNAGCMLGTRYASEKGANIITLSLGGDFSLSWEEIIRYCTGRGTTCVVSAGNEAQDTANTSPANSPSAITVASTGVKGAMPIVAESYNNDEISYFSNFGDAVDIAAPGGGIMSCDLGSGYTMKDGTSMAAPHVAAGVALLKMEFPTYSPAQLKAKICETVVDLGTPGWDRIFGHGVLDFRIFLISKGLKSHVGITSFSLTPNTSVTATYKTGVNVFRRAYAWSPTIAPGNATNKSISFVSTNPGVAVYDVNNAEIIITGAGSTTITATAHGGFTQTRSISSTLNSTDMWIDHAAANYAGGSGTLQNPYKISTAEQLAKMAYDSVKFRTNLAGVCFELTNDINLGGKEWYPITGAYYDYGRNMMESAWFGGYINGNFYTIRNMKMTPSLMDLYELSANVPSPPEPYGLGYRGFVGALSGIIRNLGFEDAEGTSIIAGTVEGATVENCFATGSSRHGLFGRVGGSFIQNCYMQQKGVGGIQSIAGFARQVIYGSIVRNCYVYGNMVAAPTAVGGFTNYISGMERVDTIIVNCFSTATFPSGSPIFISGFAASRAETNPVITRSYYSNSFAKGIDSDQGTVPVDLQAVSPSVFQNSPSFYTNPANWDPLYPWDFTNLWAISSTVNGGYPYLKGFGASLPAEPIPNANINYIGEQLTNLVAGNYRVDFGAPFTVSGTTHPISPSWIGTTIQLVKAGNGTTTKDSPAQSINIGPRPAAPSTVGKTDCTTSSNNNGTITGVTTAMQYRLGGGSWANCLGTTVNGLVPGAYEVRYFATSTSFYGQTASVVIAAFGGSSQEATPNAQIDYSSEQLTGLIAGTYKFNGQVTSVPGTTYAIQAGWFGTIVDVVKVGSGSTTDSEIQKVMVLNRPGTPVVGKTDCTTSGNNNGTITSVTTAMQYRLSTVSSWTTCPSGTVTGLASGTYHVRFSAVTGTSFASAFVQVVINAYVPPQATPNIQIDYQNELLTGFVSGQQYKFNSGAATTVSGTTYPISPSWFGTTILIVRVGNGTTATDSAAQSRVVPGRDNAPSVGKDNCGPSNNDGKITGVTTAMDYKLDSAVNWSACSGTTVNNLSPGTYLVRIRHVTGSAFASNIASVTIAQYNTSQLPTPNAVIDYVNERLTNLVAGTYRFNGQVTTVSGTTYDIPAGWFGNIFSIVRAGNGSTTFDSEPQDLMVLNRPGTPVVGKTDCTTSGNNNGTITSVTTAMQYRLSTVSSWTNCPSGTVTGLASGTYHVRFSAVTGTSFASAHAVVTIGAYIPPQATPNIQIDYQNELLTGFVSGQQYKFNSGAATTVSGTTYPISPSWFGTTILIVRVGNGTTATDSAAQSRVVPGRDNAPSVGKDNCGSSNNDGRITSVTAAMQYRLDNGSSSWTDCTGTTVENLSPGTYLVRIKYVAGSAFASNIASVIIAPYNATQEPTPNAVIDFVNERLTNLAAGTYRFNGVTTSVSGTTYNIPAGWFGQNLSIVRAGNGSTTYDSAAQTLSIYRPLAPTTVTKVDCTEHSAGVLVNVSTDMEYRLSTVSVWTPCIGTTVAGLGSGTYYVRFKAVEHNSFASEYATVIINAYVLNQKEETPEAEVNYIKGQLDGLKNGHLYKINWQLFTVVGSVIIQDSWFDTIISVVKAGNGTTTSDSNPQNLEIAARPDSPTGVGKTNGSILGFKGKITGVTTDMEYKLEGAEEWLPCTGTQLTDLPPGVYQVRTKATNATFAGDIMTVKIEAEFDTLAMVLLGAGGVCVLGVMAVLITIVARRRKKI